MIRKPKVIDLAVDEMYYEEKYKILFIKRKWGLEPIMYDCDIIEHMDSYEYSGVEIKPERTNLIYMFIRYVQKCGDRYDKISGIRQYGFLETWQWNSCIKFLLGAGRMKSEDFLQAVARQGGKSMSARMTIPFASIFLPVCSYIKESRFYSAWVSPTTRLALDHFDKMRPYFEVAIELFNEVYPETTLVTKADDRDIKDNRNTIEIDRETPNGRIPHCSFLIMSADTKSKTPGFTIHLLWVDEAQLISADYFYENMAPMTSRTGGCTIIQGTSLPSAEQLLYATYRRKSIDEKRRVFVNVEEVYQSIYLRSPDEAEDYWRRYSKEAGDFGENSDYIMSQYYVSFDIKGERWFTLEQLEELSVFRIKEIGIDNLTKTLPMYSDSSRRYYRIGSFDSAKKNDIAAFICGIVEVTEDRGDIDYNIYITDFISVNDEEKKSNKILTPEVMTERLVSLCSRYRLDMIIFEATANQDDRAFYLAKALSRTGIGTKVIPIDYSGTNKQKIFLKAESVVQCAKVALPIQDVSYQNKGYREFIEQLKIFKKEVIGSRIKFAAPEGRNLHDDFISAFAQLVYIPYYLTESELVKMRYAGLGNDDITNYPIIWYKANQASSQTERKVVYYR